MPSQVISQLTFVNSSTDNMYNRIIQETICVLLSLLSRRFCAGLMIF